MFPSLSHDPGRIPAVRRVDVRPALLIGVGRQFRQSAESMATSCRRLEAGASAVRLNPADPDHGPIGPAAGGDSGPVIELVDRLAAEGRRLVAVAAELFAASRDAIDADATTWTGPALAMTDGLVFTPLRHGPRSIDRAAGAVSVAAVRTLISRIETVYDGWDAGHLGWTGVVRSPLFAVSARPRLPVDPGPVHRRRTIGWLGPGRSAVPAGRHRSGASDRDRGVQAVARALDLTADSHWIRADEIGLIDHGNRAYTVVLPGVTDLSRPSSGWSPDHRSVRDLDMAALDSAVSSAVADNRYARAVIEALAHSGVEPGAHLTVVGHSFGADTALDLAADRRFNGQRYRIDHVVAAGYYSQPQLRDVPASTDVLVLQNRRDAAIGAERLGRWALAPLESLTAALVGSAAIGTGSRAGVTVVAFNGGVRGAGHHPENYRRIVQRAGAVATPAAGRQPGDLNRFLVRVGAGPWGRGGRLDAVNVSVPP